MAISTPPVSYYGTRGYTLTKECMEAEDLKLLREELTVGAYVPKAPVQPPKFPIYRECSKKIYIPRFYGTKIYGMPEETRIPPGTSVAESSCSLVKCVNIRTSSLKNISNKLQNPRIWEWVAAASLT